MNYVILVSCFFSYQPLRCFAHSVARFPPTAFRTVTSPIFSLSAFHSSHFKSGLFILFTHVHVCISLPPCPPSFFLSSSLLSFLAYSTLRLLFIAPSTLQSMFFLLCFGACPLTRFPAIFFSPFSSRYLSGLFTRYDCGI